MKKILKFLDKRIEEIIGIILLSIVIILIFIGVILRLGFNSGTPIQEELSRILYVITVFLGASYGIKKNDHIRVTFIYDMLNDKGKKILRVVTDALWIFFHLYMIWFSVIVYRQMAIKPGYSSALHIELHYIFAIVPISFALMTFRIIQKFVRDVRKGNLYIETT